MAVWKGKSDMYGDDCTHPPVRPSSQRGALAIRCCKPSSTSPLRLMCRRPQVIGDDVCPGIKAGGRINWIRRTIPCLARGDCIPPAFTVDIRCRGWVGVGR